MARERSLLWLLPAFVLACGDDAPPATADAAATAPDGAVIAPDGGGANGGHYYVSPTGDDGAAGTSPDAPFATIQHAVDLAQPGDTIHLAGGDYLQDVVSVRDGTAAAPITIIGPADAVVRGGGGARVIQLHHDHLTLDGFTVDGLFGDPDSADGYRDKLVYVIGQEPLDGVTGLRILRMTLRNGGGECLRLRYFAVANEVAESTFTSCGVHDFVFGAGGKNGEAIYIGTAPEQLADGKNPTDDPDESNDNWIHDNQLDTQGNECVDIKEAATRNVVEDNVCTGQKDPESAGFDSRGSGNVFRRNQSFGNLGAGVRLGGDAETDGIDNDVYENDLHDNAAGGIKFQRAPQGKVCGNTMADNSGGDAVGTYGGDFDPTAPCP